jgi:iron-sulfur cluster assembly protein
METAIQSPVNFTEGAMSEIRRLMEEPGFDSSNYLRVGVKGGGCSGMTYVLGFDQRKDGDTIYEFDGVRFVMDKAHEIYLYGFTFNNPNASTTCGCGTSFAV